MRIGHENRYSNPAGNGQRRALAAAGSGRKKLPDATAEESAAGNETVAVSRLANLLRKAAKRIPAERLWVNPDCGLKTRGWPETEAALIHMVAAARQLRAELA